ncbi:MAG: acyloxyacyl hydrolase [Phycisphaeraceae bacterium]|nr:acyloxyacyl hydrolase [Phycisphaeraceae bacterium]
MIIRSRLAALTILTTFAWASESSARAEVVSLTDLFTSRCNLDLSYQPEPEPQSSSDAAADVRTTAPTPNGSITGSPEQWDDRPGFGQAGATFLTLGGLWAYDFDEDHDVNFHVAWSKFLVNDLEFAVEGAGWYFSQVGQDTGGVSGSMIFRWHFLHADDYSWSLFGDIGIGLLAGFDNVPQGGTGLNFLPRAGMGVTGAFRESVDGESHGPRWQIGLRWHHISNGRIEGDGRNPARDSLAMYAAIILPF